VFKELYVYCISRGVESSTISSINFSILGSNKIFENNNILRIFINILDDFLDLIS